MTQDMNNKVTRYTMKAKWLRTLLLTVFMTAGAVEAWGQDYSGVYYIAYFGNNKYNPNNPSNTDNHYWCPVDCSGNWKAWFQFYPDDDVENDTKADTYSKTTNTEMDFLTTYRFKKDANYDSREAVWIITKHEAIANAYYIQHGASEKYLTLNGYMNGTTSTGQNRLRVHLQSAKASNNKSVFTIKKSNNYFLICPLSLDGKQWINVSTDATDVNKQNKDANSLIGTDTKGGVSGLNVGGTLGYYNSGDNDHNSKWYLEPASAASPTITNNLDGTFTIATTTTEATIYYTTDGTTPNIETSTNRITSVDVTQTWSLTVIKAIAKRESDAFPSLLTTYELPKCEKPVITVSGGNITITSATEGATIYYTTDGTPVTSSSTTYSAPFAKGDATAIKAIARKPGYANSIEVTLLPPTEVSSSSQITDMSGNYILASNFTQSAPIGTASEPFSGTIDGDLVTLSGFRHPLVAYANGATIKNVMLKDVEIGGSGSIGAIAGVAEGYSRIYNCGILPSNNKYKNETSFVSSSDGYCGGLVG